MPDKKEVSVSGESAQACRTPSGAMRLLRGGGPSAGLAALATLLGVAAGPAAGQAAIDFRGDENLLVGYVVNAPSQILGGGVAATFPVFGGLGLYADAKLTADSPARDVLLPLTPGEAEDLGDTFFSQSSAWTTFNLAVLKGVSRELALYVGGGLSWRTTYSQYVDDTGERGELGRYWVEDEGQPERFTNFLGGAFFRLGSRVAFQFGAERAPGGFTAGAHFLLW